MKTIIILSFFILSQFSQANVDTAARRSNGLLRFMVEQQGLRDLALKSVINNRCSRYLPEAEKSLCKDAVKKMVTLLDYDVIFSDDKDKPTGEETWTPKSFVFVAFKSKLIALLSSARTTEYLYNLNQNLYRYLVENKNAPNIWDLTKVYYKGDYDTAEAIATLFQDTSTRKLHVAWLEKAEIPSTAVFNSNKELLSRVIDTINLILDSSEDRYRELFYPEEIQRDLNRNIYHFYVPLYLAKALVREGVGSVAAYQAALFLTLTYEFVTSASDYRYLYRDPDTISDPNKLKDIFGGYCGTNVGLRGMNFSHDFQAFGAAFERSTADGVFLLLKH